MIKDLLLIIDNAERAAPIVRTAVAMATRLDAGLTVQILTPNPILFLGLVPMGTMWVPETALAKDEAAHVEAIRAMTAAASAPVRILGLHDDLFALPGRAGAAGPVADLILMGDADLWETPWLRRRAAETIVMAGGTPLLILSGATNLSSVRYAAIGWKDSAETRHAVHDLITLVEPGGRIAVVCSGVEEGDAGEVAESAGEVVRHLVRHGFQAETHVLLQDGQSDAAALEGFALRGGAQLLAIGAFGHSRFRDVVLGGVTRSLIERPRLPLLLSH